MDAHYVITRGVKPGKNLTTAQRSSSKFSEEPVVLGKVLRARSLPMKVSVEQFNLNRVELERLEKAGAINIHAPFKLAVDSLTQENQMGTPSTKFGGTPTVHPAEANVPPEVPVVETAPVVPEVVPEVTAPVEVTPVEAAPVVTEEAPKQDEVPAEAPVETRVEGKGKKGKK